MFKRVLSETTIDLHNSTPEISQHFFVLLRILEGIYILAIKFHTNCV